MRCLGLLLPLLLAACHQETDFDQRYDKAAKEIEARAKTMDTNIAEAEKAAATTQPKSLPASAKPANAPASSGE